MFRTIRNWLGEMMSSSKRPGVKPPNRLATPGVEGLEERMALSTTSVLGASLAGGARMIDSFARPAEVRADAAVGLAGSNRDDPFFRTGYRWAPAARVEVSQDDPFFRDGRSLAATAPGDDRDAVFIKEVDPRPADVASYMWSPAARVQKV